MLTQSQRKMLRALQRKKEREAHRCFLVEGVKCVEEMLRAQWPVELLYATGDWEPPPGCCVELRRITEEEMAQISVLETASPVLAVASMDPPRSADVTQGRWLALDGLQDPGNVGTILRLADWFGLDGLICSPDTVEITNPKVVQASMGSIFRVTWLEGDLAELLASLPGGVWTAGAFLGGDNLFQTALPSHGILVVGNEGRGIRPATEALLGCRLTIPRFGEAESLNAAMATAVFCAEWRRAG